MSMTESEKYIEIIKSLDCENITSIVCDYNKTGCSDCSFMIAKNKAIQALSEIQQYRAIGTVSEFRELKEKANPNKPYYVPYDSNPNIGNWHCPTCHGIVLYYHRVCGCGKHLDWS